MPWPLTCIATSEDRARKDSAISKAFEREMKLAVLAVGGGTSQKGGGTTWHIYRVLARRLRVGKTGVEIMARD